MATRDPEATKQRILDAALREFSEKGIAGARVDAIAARAKVNKRMLYYYFGSKEGLFQEILRRRVDESTVALQDADVAGPGGSRGASTRWPRSRTTCVCSRGKRSRERNGHLVNEPIRRAFFKDWIAAVEAEQRAGNVPADLDAAQLVLAELCLVIGPLLLPQLTRLVTGSAPTSRRQLERRREFLATLAERIGTGAADDPRPRRKVARPQAGGVTWRQRRSYSNRC